MKYLAGLVFLIVLTFTANAQKTQTETYEAENIGYFITPVETPYGIVFTDNYASKIYLLNEGQVETLTASPGCGRYFSVSENGKYISFKSVSNEGKQASAYYDLEKRKTSLISEYSEKANQLTFNADLNLSKILNINVGNSNLTPVSPDGINIVYDVNQEYFIVKNIETGTETKLPNDKKGVVYPKWSPDGKKLLFQNRNYELLVYDFSTQKLYKIGKGGAGNWDSKSENIVYQISDTDTKNFILNSSDIYISDYKGKNKRQITNTPDIYEMTPSFDLQGGIIYQTYDKRQIVRAELNLSKTKIISKVVLLNNPKNIKPEFYDTSKFKQTESIAHLAKNVPYIHQKYDAPTGRNGSSACAPTTSNMALAYYNRLPKWKVSAENYPSITGSPHYSYYSSYILDRYKYNEFSFDAYSSSKNAYGGYAYMWISPYSSPGNDGMRNYQNLHDMASGSYVWLGSATYEKAVAEINNEYPQPICSWITASGHLTLVVGYVIGQHTLIFNDPWGNKNTPGYPSYDGKDAYYDWPGYNNGYQNLDADGSHGTVAWTLTARSSEPVYDNMRIDNTSYNHGFYMNNSEDGAKQRYYRHVKDAAGSNGHIWWTGGEGGASSDICWVTWTPDLPDFASYKVEVYIPANFTDIYSTAAVTSSAYYKIFYAGGNTSVTVNQLANQGTWVDLGTYQFMQGQNGYVRLGDAVASGDNGKKVLFDAVRFTKTVGSLEVFSTNVTCTGANDGTATVTASPGPDPHSYFWSPGGQTDSSVSGLPPGTYSVTVTDANSATYNASVIINEAEELLTISADFINPTTSGASDGSITINTNGGVEPYNYAWSPNVSSTNVAQNLSAGVYTVTVTDAYGCSKQEEVTLTDPLCSSCCVFLNENFTGQVLPFGWSNIVNSGGNASYKWRFDDPGGRYASGVLNGAGFDSDFAIFDDDFFGDNGNKSDASITTPAINCTGKDVVMLRFSHRFKSSTNVADGTVQVSNDGSIWNNIVTYNTTTVGPIVEYFDISAYAANQITVYVRFRYTDNSNWSNYWAIDNVKIYAPPAGTKTISANGGDYANFTEAINAINTCGIGTGGVSFLVPADEVFTEDPPVITATGTATKPVIFQKSGTGANPIIKATGTASSDDAAIKIAGGDYFTFDGIDIQIATGSSLEYGYCIYNNSATDGAQHNTIKNCSVTLNNTNEISKGVFQYIRTGTVDPTTADGANSFNLYDNILIKNTYYGICLHGYDVAGQDALYDDACEIKNITVDGFGLAGATANRATGIQTWSQKNLLIHNNSVKNGISGNRTLGIYCAGNNTGSIYTNKVSGLYGEGIQVVGIREYNSNMNIYNNEVSTVEGIKMATGIEGYGGTSTVYNNFVYDIKTPAGNSVTNGYPSTRGISFRYTTGTQSVFYNSVYIAYYSSNAGNESSAFYLDNSTADLRNNIFENNTDATTGTRATVLYFKGSSDLANLSVNSNNNCYYNGVATSKYALAYDAGNSVEYLDLTSYAAASPGDANSIEETPPFKSTSAPYDLHINPNSLTKISDGGIPINGYSFDFDEDTRDTVSPDIGADEYDCDYILWQGTTDTDWATASNWQKQQVPTISDNVIIPDVSSESSNFPNITSAAETNNLTIQSGANLRINPNFSLTVNGIMTNNSGTSGLLIKSDASGTGSFINSTTNVPATAERFLSGTRWHYLTAPVIDAPLSLFNTNNFYFYDETTSDSWSGGVFSGTSGWINYTNPVLTSMQGYAYYFNETTLNFTGNLHSGTYTSPLLSWTNTAMQDEYEGWHLLGNPYPSAVDFSQTNIDAGNITLTNLDNTVYFYDDITGNYKYYNTTTGGANGGTRFIPAMQGFFVHATANNGQLQITDAARVHNTTSFYKTKTNTEVSLIASGNNFSDETKIVVLPDASPEFDSEYDAYKMFSENTAVPFLYSIAGNTEYAINTVPEIFENSIIPLGFSAQTSGNYQIKLNNVSGINLPIYLYDKQLNLAQNLSENNTYSFSFPGGVEKNRFELRFSQLSDIENISNNDIIIYPNPAKDRIQIISNSEILNIELSNVSGKILIRQDRVDVLNTGHLSAGVYFLKITTKNGIFTKKVIKE